MEKQESGELSGPATAVSFDVWRTILKPNPNFAHERRNIIARWLGTSIKRIVSVVDEVEREGNAMQESGRDMDLAQRMARIAEHMGRTTEPIEVLAAMRDVSSAFEAFPPSLLEGDVTLQTMQALHDCGMDVRIASNTGFVSGASIRALLERVGILSNVSIAAFSDEVGFSKPHPNIFRMVADGNRPDCVLHVGDDPVRDYAGATRYGMRALLLCSQGNTDRFADHFYVIRSIQEVLTHPLLWGEPVPGR